MSNPVCLSCHKSMTKKLVDAYSVCNLCYKRTHEPYKCQMCNTHICTVCAMEENELKQKAIKNVTAYCEYCNKKLKRMSKCPYSGNYTCVICNNCNKNIHFVNKNVVYHCDCKQTGYDLCAICVNNYTTKNTAIVPSSSKKKFRKKFKNTKIKQTIQYPHLRKVIELSSEKHYPFLHLLKPLIIPYYNLSLVIECCEKGKEDTILMLKPFLR